MSNGSYLHNPPVSHQPPNISEILSEIPNPTPVLEYNQDEQVQPVALYSNWSHVIRFYFYCKQFRFYCLVVTFPSFLNTQLHSLQQFPSMSDLDNPEDSHPHQPPTDAARHLLAAGKSELIQPQPGGVNTDAMPKPTAIKAQVAQPEQACSTRLGWWTRRAQQPQPQHQRVNKLVTPKPRPVISDPFAASDYC